MDSKDRKIINNLIAVLEKFWQDPRKTFWRQFLLGIAYGLGATLGVAIILSLVGYVFRSLGGLPVVGEWLNSLSGSIPNR